jgi:hypothetical protein
MREIGDISAPVRGDPRLIRYADDFVVCFQREDDARRFRIEL